MKTRKAPTGRSFSSRNPVVIGAVSIVVIAILVFGAFNSDDLPIIGGGTVYTAAFTEAAGLRAGDEVRIAGVRVGKVDAVELGDTTVDVTFRVKNQFVGDETTASIEIKTLLGRKYLALDVRGGKEQNPDSTIPVDRTVSPFDIYPAFQQLTETTDAIDSDQLAKAFTSLSSAFQDTPESIRGVLDGLSRLSQTVASRDAQLRSLLAAANNVTGILADRSADLQRLIDDGSLLLDELNQRRDAIRMLLTNTSALAIQLEGLVADNDATLGPALDQLSGVIGILTSNLDSIDRGLGLLAPFYRVFANTLGSGRWFDTYIQNFNASFVLQGLPGLGVSGVPTG
ncbi:MCE family protein [Jatrophihabitans sp. YIM 134969]